VDNGFRGAVSDPKPSLEFASDIAIEVMGWHAADTGYEPGDIEWLPSEWWLDEKNERQCRVFSWRPDLDIGQAMQVVEKLKRGLLVETSAYSAPRYLPRCPEGHRSCRMTAPAAAGLASHLTVAEAGA
jgi:hypothetical protein